MKLILDVHIILFRELHSFGAVRNLKDKRKDFYNVVCVNQ